MAQRSNHQGPPHREGGYAKLPRGYDQVSKGEQRQVCMAMAPTIQRGMGLTPDRLSRHDHWRARRVPEHRRRAINEI